VATDRLRRWRAAGGDGEAALDAVRDALDDDLDLPGAVAAIDEAAAGGAVGPGRGVSRAADLLGVAL